MSLQTADVVRVLTEMKVGYQIDPLNPTYTVLLNNGGMVDTIFEDGKKWNVLSLDRQFYKDVTNEEELRTVMQELIERDGA
jgi:hypothetical protein